MSVGRTCQKVRFLTFRFLCKQKNETELIAIYLALHAVIISTEQAHDYHNIYSSEEKFSFYIIPPLCVKYKLKLPGKYHNYKEQPKHPRHRRKER